MKMTLIRELIESFKFDNNLQEHIIMCLIKAYYN